MSKFHPNQISSCVEGDTNIHFAEFDALCQNGLIELPIGSAAQKLESRECTSDFSAL